MDHSKLADQAVDNIARQQELIDLKLREQPTDQLLLQKLRESSEATVELAKVTAELTHSMSLETEANKELLITSTFLFKVSLDCTKKLYKLAQKTNVEFSQLGGNKGTPFLSRCLAKGCNNPEVYEWYHPGGSQINSYRTDMTYYLMKHSDNSGKIVCTYCVGLVKPIEDWVYACHQHKDQYRPVR